MALVTASIAVAPAVVAFAVAVGGHLAMAFPWTGRIAMVLTENIGECIGGQDLFTKVARTVHPLDCGAYWIHRLTEKGKAHGCFVAVEHRESVEDVQWTEDIECLEMWE